MSRVWLITGTSTGFGRELAEVVLEGGGQVVATARRVEALEGLRAKYRERVLAVRLDVTSASDIAAAVSAARERFGRIDVLVNNAGFGMVGAVEETSDAELRRIFETNFFGAMAVTRAVLPLMREQGSGHILNVSSIGGLTSLFPGFGAYCATKFALEAESEALSVEMRPFGVRVTIVEPGAFRTAFNGSSNVRPAESIVRVVESSEPPLRLLLGSDALAEARRKLEVLRRDIDAWEEVTKGTNFPGVETGAIGG
jgi:NAD(P)-dependent dehydrogenase (short-subunit alcohol dehydrogenase family)